MYDVKGRINETYKLIKENIPPHIPIDSLEVAKQVEEYRRFWKPRKSRVILLAESHVYTDKKELEIKCKKSILNKIMPLQKPNYPVNFVRFVYCLGYGENELLTTELDDNKRGTPQFWKIFSYCVAEDETKVLKMGTWKKTRKNLEKRLKNKVSVLQKMLERGIWLLDASIVSVTEIKRDKTIKQIIEICWKHQIEKLILKSRPEHIVVIGKRVEKALGSELPKLQIPFDTLPQPRGKSIEYFEEYERICQKHR